MNEIPKNSVVSSSDDSGLGHTASFPEVLYNATSNAAKSNYGGGLRDKCAIAIQMYYAIP